MSRARPYDQTRESQLMTMMNEFGVYLYGFIPSGASIDLENVAGIEGDDSVKVVVLPCASAVVGEIVVEPFEAALADGPNPDWLIPRALGHERVLGAVLTRSAVLPVRFGTLFSSREALASLSETYATAIGDYFATVGDRCEWSLKGWLDAEAADRALELDPELAVRKARLPDSPGVRYFQEKRLRDDARLQARRIAACSAAEVRAALREVSSEVRSLPLKTSTQPAREIVLSDVLLLCRGCEHEALEAAERASSRTGGLLTLESSGPLPPYHFCPRLADASR